MRPLRQGHVGRAAGGSDQESLRAAHACLDGIARREVATLQAANGRDAGPSVSAEGELRRQHGIKVTETSFPQDVTKWPRVGDI